jgi:hypothetical protein
MKIELMFICAVVSISLMLLVSFVGLFVAVWFILFKFITEVVL